MRFMYVMALLWSISVVGQPAHYTTANAHSHNDYENPVPFKTAYAEGFGSIEADIFLQDGKLLVGHDLNEIKSQRTLEEYYLSPMQACLEKNHQHIYADTNRHLQLLIDVKTEAVSTLTQLIKVLRQYPQLIENPHVHFVISGNRPDPEKFNTYPSYILFDGELLKEYTAPALEKIALLSDNFIKYAFWNGKDTIPGTGITKLKKAINKAHAVKKPVRFWASPDNPNAWQQFMQLGVDYINTDKIKELSEFFK